MNGSVSLSNVDGDSVDDGGVDDNGVVDPTDEPWLRRHSPHGVKMDVVFVMRSVFGELHLYICLVTG